jgi:hypothetical protein
VGRREKWLYFSYTSSPCYDGPVWGTLGCPARRQRAAQPKNSINITSSGHNGRLINGSTAGFLRGLIKTF